jgi:Fe-S-cluster containining protein
MAAIQCRKFCGACCIMSEIQARFEQLPEGKPRFIPCIHLGSKFECTIYEKRPQVCRDFEPRSEWCGSTQKEALNRLWYIFSLKEEI